MARYSIEGPDKHLYEFDGPDNAPKETIMGYAKQLYDNRQASLKTAGMGEAFMGGAKHMLGSMQTGIQGIFNPEEAAKEGRARQEAITERPGASLEKVKSVYNEKGLFPAAREAISEIPSAISEQAANLGVNLVGARLGAMGGAELGTLGGPYAPVTVPVGTLLGGLAGAFAPNYIQQAGSDLERQAQEGKPINAGAAYSAAVPQAALDVFTDKLMFSKLMGIPVAKLGRAEADAIVAKSLKRTLAEGTVKGVAAEVPTEVAQQMLERYQAGLSLTDADARKEYADTAYQTALLGPLGAIGNVQERGEAKQVVAQDEAAKAAAALQAQRRATGVMDQQPLFNPQKAPIPEPTSEIPDVEEPAPAPISTVAPEPTPVAPAPINVTRDDQGNYIAEAPKLVSNKVEGQADLFTSKGTPSPAAKASVEAARVQGLPAQVEQLLQTPEGRTELASNMKTYFPHLDKTERNKTRQAIQQGTYGVAQTEAPTAPVEGTLTPDLLKSFGIKGGAAFDTLNGMPIGNPLVQQHLQLLAASSKNKAHGIAAYKILDNFGLLPTEAAATSTQPKPTEVVNEPQTKNAQPDLLGVQQNGVSDTTQQQGTEQGMGMPVQSTEAKAQETPKPVGGGVGSNIQLPASDTNAAGPSTTAQPSTLAPVPKKVAREAAADLKKLPIVELWDDFETGKAFGILSKTAKDQVRDAVAGNYLTQDLADDIVRREEANKTKEAVANKIAKGSPELTAQILSRKVDEAIDAQQELEKNPKSTQKQIKAGMKKVDALIKKYNHAIYDSSPEAAPSISEQPIDITEAKQVEQALTDKSQVEAAKWLAEHAPDKSMKLIAEKVAIQLQKLKDAGVNQKLSIVHIGDSAPQKLHPHGVLGISHYNYADKNPFVHVYLKGTDFGKGNIGTTFKTALHELIHAATQAVITFGNTRGAAGTKFSADVLRLNDVRNTVLNRFNRRVAESKLGKTQLTKFEQAALAGDNNALDSLDEMVTWALTDKDMQEYLESIPYKGNQSLWSEFVTVIRNMLGLPASADTALSEVLSVSENLLSADISAVKQTAENAGFALHIDPVAQAQANNYIAGMSGTLAQSVPTQTTTATQAAQNFVQTTISNPSGAFGMIENLVNQVRTKVIDKAAHLSASIQDHNDGAFYDVNNQIRADLNVSAANNANNYINAVFTLGDMEILPDGAMHAKQGQFSVDNIFRHASALGDRIGVEQARKLITDVFYHYRAKAIIDNVPQDEWPENWLKDPRMVPTTAQINAAMAAFNQFPELRAMQREFIGTKNQMVRFLRKAGFLTHAKATAFLNDNSYAPWLRLKDYQDKIPGLGNMGKMVDLQQMKALVGGTEEVNDMLENMAQMIGWCVRSGISNHTANGALETMTSMGTATRHPGRPMGGNPAHVVMTYVDGKPTFWTVDNPWDLATFQSVKGLNSTTMKVIGKWLGKLRAGIVLFPAFPLRQVVMDSQRAFAEAGVKNPWSMVGKIYKSFLSGEAFRGQHQDIQELMQYGVVGGADFTAMDTTRGRANQFGIGEKAETITDKWVRSPAYNFLHKLAYSADLAVRLGIYRQTLEETGDKTLAATKAREIINFQKAGTSELMHTLKQTIPFLGAYLQGMDVNYRSMVGRGNSMQARKAAAAAYWGNMAMYAGLVVAYTMMMSGDDDYEDQKGFITDRNFLIPGTKLMLPVPTDVGFLAKVVPERITDYILQEGTDSPESAKRLREGILQSFAAGYLPPAAVYGVTPAVELMLNKSFFSDMPIVSQRLQGVDPQFQYTASTSELAKEIGAITGQSPIQIDYLFNAIGGTSAGALLQLADVGSSKMASDKLPIVSSFQQKTVGGRNAEEYYALREMSDKVYNTVQQLATEQDPEKLQAYIGEPKNQRLYAMHEGMESIHATLSNVSHMRNIIENDPNLTPEEKRQRVNEILTDVESALRAAPIRKLRAENE